MRFACRPAWRTTTAPFLFTGRHSDRLAGGWHRAWRLGPWRSLWSCVDPPEAEFCLQLFQTVGGSLTWRPGAAPAPPFYRGSLGGPNPWKRLAVSSVFGEMARTLLNTGHLSRPDRLHTFSLSLARACKEASLERGLSLFSLFLIASAFFRLFLLL